MKKFYFSFRKVVLGLFLTTTVLTYSQKIYNGKQADEIVRGSQLVRESNYSPIPSYVSFRPGSEKDPSTFILWLQKNFKVDANISFELIRTEQDQLGMTHSRYRQTLNGNPIQNGVMILHIKDGKVISFNGLIYKSIDPGNASLSESAALVKAKSHIGATTYKWELPGEEEHLKWEQNDPTATYFPSGELVYVSPAGKYASEEVRLAYKFNIYAHQPVSRQDVYVDAQTGQILLENEIIHHADAVGTAVTGYSGNQTITTDDQGGGSFRLRETGRGNGVRTFNMQEGTSYGGSVDFTDADNNWNNVNAQLDQYATDAHWGAEMTYDYFFNAHGRNSIDNNGFQLNSYVHYDSGYDNAFWDGQRMTYGDGSSNNPFTAIDIAGHEIGHGLTSFTADLVYQDEPGALNESFSDIFGILVENYGRPSNWNWTMGEDIGFILRNMSNPNATGDPDTYFGNNWAALGGADNGGVHTNSSVQNYWFYLVASGGNGTNDNSDSYNVTGIGMSDAADVAYRNLTVYLVSSSDYADARFYGIQSAIDLFGSCSNEVETVTNAWYAVGVGPAYVPYALADFEAPVTQACQAPFTVDFSNLSINGTSFTWNFGDGSPVSNDFSPSHTYSTTGLYTVTLDIDGGACGTDQIVMTNYIDIDPGNPCITILTPNTTMPTQNACSGTVFDSGGPSGAYGPNEISTITIAPTGASQVTLNFPFFDIEPGTGSSCDYDQLLIYDGNSIAAPLIGTYCNNNVPTSVSSTGGAITVRFTSDPGLELNGFEMTWACTIPTNAPTADFTVDNATNCTGTVQFSDNSVDNPTDWLWDFGDGNTSTDPNPTHTYAANGTYSVTLTVSNSIGSDDEVKTNFITIATPTPPTTTDATVCANDPVTLNASGTGTLDWYDAQSGGNLVYSGSSWTIDPLTATATYYVEDNLATAPVSVGPSDNTFGAGANFAGDQGLIFDAFQPCILKSVKVYAEFAGYRQVELRNSSGQLIENKAVYMPAGESRVYLGMAIPQGTDLELRCLYGSNPNLYRNSASANYPYTATGLVSIKRSTAGGANALTYYYYFYDWEIQEEGCRSFRSSITATADNCAGLADNGELNYKIYPNPFHTQLTIEMAGQFDFEVTNAFGQEIISENNLSQITHIDLSQLSKGIYFVKIKAGGEVRVEKIVKE
ncbi:MAG: M4 family metallopeptidase [Crocinitomicaceae bacterium]|nr:M4 family metallopeptidase [Crocinitomicaceae bacterium]